MFKACLSSFPPQQYKRPVVLIILNLDMIEKVVAYVMDHGEGVVEQIKKDEAHNPKFRFLFDEDPFHKVYLETLQRARKQQAAASASHLKESTEQAGKKEETPEEEEFEDVIYPPPELRLVVDKTASAVAKNGLEFQERIRENSLRDPKFSFLNPNDPYNRYYALKVKELVEGKRYLKPLEEGEEDKSMIVSIFK